MDMLITSYHALAHLGGFCVVCWFIFNEKKW